MFRVSKRFLFGLLIGVCLLPMLALLVTGCQTYGSKRIDIVLKTLPPNRPAYAYLVPIEHWAEFASPETLQPFTPRDANAFQQRLERYRVKGKRTPVQTQALPYRTVYLAEWNGHFWWTVIKPGTTNQFVLSLE